LKLITPHENQKKILSGRKRFTHLKCGRRFGKTILINLLVARAFINMDKQGNLLRPMKIGIWFPVYKDLQHVWLKMKNDYHDLIAWKSEELKQIHTLSGGVVDFWSMQDPDSGRGLDYDRAILDEFAKAGKNKQAWQNTIRPTLTDRGGDAWISSTPMGKRNYFYEMQIKHKDDPDWAFFKFTSYDNPYLDPNEIDTAKNQLDPISFKQEYLAEDVDANEKEFLYCWDEEKNVTEKHVNIDPNLPVWLSFDFNVVPQTCIVAQRLNEDYLHVIKLIRLDNASIYDMCDRIKVLLPHYYMVTGDASGRNRSNVSNQSNWQVIKKELNLSDRQIKLRSKNLNHRESQVICNSVLQHKKILVNSDLKELIDDCAYATTDEHGKLVKTIDRGLHFFDGFRYLLDANFPEILRIKQ